MSIEYDQIGYPACCGDGNSNPGYPAVPSAPDNIHDDGVLCPMRLISRQLQSHWAHSGGHTAGSKPTERLTTLFRLIK